MTSRLSSANAVAFSVLTALGASVWSGCGPGGETRYYCDDQGCYTCDAYGCSTVATTPHQPCTGTASCAPGSACTSTGCALVCSSDAACPKGEVCKSGVCDAPSSTPGAPKGCTTKADCAGGQACVASTCQACGGTAGPCPCQAASDCAAGQTCAGNVCTAPQNSCKFTSECGDGKICADGQCLVSCDVTPCSAGFACDKGVCKPQVTTAGCTGDAQCTSADAPKCLAGSCVKPCTLDPECGAGNYCNQGACAVDTRPKPNCTGDVECGGTAATPKKCVGGFCKYTCASDQYCRTIDSRIGYCAKDAVCRTFAEANASCTQPSDCAPGQDCIDNQCK